MIKKLLTVALTLTLALGCIPVVGSETMISFASGNASGNTGMVPTPTPTPTIEPAKKNETIKNQAGDSKASYKVTNTSDKKASVTFTKTSSKSKTVSIPATVEDKSGKTYKVTTVAKSALKGNKKVTTLKIGKNIQNIGKNAFNGAKNLKKVTLNGNSLKSVGKNAFKGVNKKCKITIEAKSKTQFNKIVKMIQKSGAKNIEFVYKKKK